MLSIWAVAGNCCHNKPRHADLGPEQRWDFCKGKLEDLRNYPNPYQDANSCRFKSERREELNLSIFLDAHFFRTRPHSPYLVQASQGGSLLKEKQTACRRQCHRVRPLKGRSHKKQSHPTMKTTQVHCGCQQVSKSFLSCKLHFRSGCAGGGVYVHCVENETNMMSLIKKDRAGGCRLLTRFLPKLPNPFILFSSVFLSPSFSRL